MRKAERAAARGADDIQAQLSETWSQQFSRSGETYGRLFAAMRDEFASFVQRRLDANLTTMREWSECRSFNDAFALQQRWVERAVEQYIDQGNRVMETCRLAAGDMTETTVPKAESERSTPERRTTAAHRHAEPDIKQAA